MYCDILHYRSTLGIGIRPRLTALFQDTKPEISQSQDGSGSRVVLS